MKNNMGMSATKTKQHSFHLQQSWLQKTIIVTDQATKKSCAISFKGVKAQIEELPYQSTTASITVQSQQTPQQNDTFSLMQSHDQIKPPLK